MAYIQVFVASFIWILPKQLLIPFVNDYNQLLCGILDGASNEKKLAQYLLYNYKILGRTGRPVKNSTQSVLVKFGLGLISMNVEEKDNMLSLSVWTRLTWKDEYLTWYPGDFGNLTTIKLPQSQIWKPDLMLYNTASTESFERTALAVVDSEGIVSWFPHRIYHTTCSIDVKKFPFDNQTCHMLFGSWTHASNEIDVDFIFPGGLDLSTFQRDFKESSRWDILKVDAEKTVLGDSPGFSVLVMTVHLKRKMIFSSYILTFPVILLGFLTSLLFWLPTGSTDKTNLGLTIFGGLLLLLLILVEAAPPTASGVPLLGVYYCFNIAVVILSIFLSSIVSKVESCQDVVNLKRVPVIVRKIFFSGFARFVCTYNSDYAKFVKRNFTPSLEETMNEASEHLIRIMTTVDKYENHTTHTTSLTNNGEVLNGILENIDRPLVELCSMLRAYVKKKNDVEKQEQLRYALETEWKYLGLILDRLFMIIYLSIVVASIVLLFPK